MVAVNLLFALAQLQAAPPRTTLQFFQESFVIRRAGKALSVPLTVAAPPPPLHLSFRKNDNYAVWDDRGLSIRRGAKMFTTLLPDIATSPKMMERDELVQTVELIGQGVRKREASALSGARRIGSEVFFLVRWDDRDGNPWLEALVKVELDGETVKPQLVGRFGGLSLSREAIGDSLHLRNGILATYIRQGDAWGEAFYAGAVDGFGFRKLGERLETFERLSPQLGRFVERTPHGTLVAGEIDLETGARSELLEVRGQLRFLDEARPLLAVITQDARPAVRNAETGAELRLPADFGIRRCPEGVLVWTPATKPATAWLYEPTAWRKLAGWQR